MVYMHKSKDKYSKRIPNCFLWETQFKYKNIYGLKVNGLKKMYHANTNKKKTGVTIPISKRADF